LAFGAIWGAAMWLFWWRSHPFVSSLGMVLAAAISGAMFGLLTAVSNRMKRNRYDLPRWDDV
jgi:membrane associated rhomboid family serine protease